MVAEAKGEPIPFLDNAPAGPAVKAEDPETPEPIVRSIITPAQKAIAARKKKSFTTQVVTITNKDMREAEFQTTVTLGFENQHFGLTKIVPLDIPCELEYGLIRVAEATNMTLHKDEVVNGARTGNKRPVTVKKFAISYAKPISG